MRAPLQGKETGKTASGNPLLKSLRLGVSDTGELTEEGEEPAAAPAPRAAPTARTAPATGQAGMSEQELQRRVQQAISEGYSEEEIQAYLSALRDPNY